MNRYRWFKIPGVGCFRSRTETAHVNHLEGLIYPGCLKIGIEPHEDTDPEEMLESLSSDFGYAKAELSGQLNALSKAALAQLESSGHFDFIPFGTLEMNSNTLVFNQTEFNIHKEFYGAVPLPVQAVQKTIQAEQLPIKTPIPYEQKKKRGIHPLFIILGILWIIFLVLLFWPDKKPNKTSTDPIAPDSSMILTSEDSALLQSIQAIETDSTPVDSISSLVVIDKDSQEAVITPAVVDSLSQIVLNKECIIIVGSFVNINYANRLAQKIGQQNLIVYRGQYGKYNRVGVKFDCMEKDLKQVLSELKQHFNPDAWVLKM
ncbi:MAG: hypothetical protein IPM34_05965 [Saprospiraceae bacterium]|nr:hypothetical protein [Saprospiraceae bacterium]